MARSIGPDEGQDLDADRLVPRDREAAVLRAPESAHRVAHALLGLPLPWERLGDADRDPTLRVRLAGIELANPVGLAAGFDKRGSRLGALGRLGFGYVVGGTFTRRHREGKSPGSRAIGTAHR